MKTPEDSPVTKIADISAEERQKLTKAVSTLKKAYLTKPKPTAYQEFLRAESVDIAKQSTINFQNLLRQLDDISWLPADEQQWYVDTNGNQLRFSEDESLLISVWQTQLVPLFTLKHASHYVDDFDVLTSLGEREKSGKIIINGHTNRHAIRYNAFATLGFGENHETPSFLGDEAEEIIVSINKMGEDIINLRGLWISTHLTEFYNSRCYNPIEFGGTKRQESYEKSGLKKTVLYTRQDGTQFNRRLTYKDEIFAANPSINVIFDVLLYQFILELRYLGKTFRKYVKEHINDSHKLISIFHTLFPSWIYPEVKLPRPLVIKNKPYVTIRPKRSEKENSQSAAFFNAIITQNNKTVEKLIKNPSLVNMRDFFGFTPLEQAIKSKNIPAIRMLLAAGANPYQPESLIISALGTGNVDIIDIFCRGIKNSTIDSISYFFDLNIRREEVVALICSQHNVAILLEKIKEYHLDTDNLPVLVWVYQDRKDLVTQLLPFYDLNAHAHGKTILMSAAEKGDNDLIKELIKLGVDLNFSITYPKFSREKRKREKWTALHYAVRYGHKETVELLIEAGADLKAENSKGLTPLELAQALQNRNKAESVVKKDTKRLSNSFFLPTRSKDDIRPSPKLSLLQRSTQRQYSCVALITIKINGELHIVLVRKSNYAGKPVGHYLAPGGLIDKTDRDSRSATCREISEETNLTVNPENLTQVYEFEYLNGAKYYCTTFFHIELPESNQAPRLVPKSDIAEAVLIKWSELTLDTDCVKLKGFPIKPSNILLFRSIIEAKQIPCDEVTKKIIYEDHEGLETLLNAINNKDIKEVEKLCSQRIDPSQSTVLHHVCELKESEETLSIIKILLSYGADINKLKDVAAARLGFVVAETPLSTAIRCGNEKVVDLLLANGADVNLGFINTFPVTIACFKGDISLVKKLLAKGAILEQNIGGNMLLSCIYAGRLELAIELLKTGKINLNKKYRVSTTPLSYPLEFAVRRVAIPFIDLLVSYGAQIDILSDEKLSLLELLDQVERTSLLYKSIIDQQSIKPGLIAPTLKSNIFPVKDIQQARLCLYKEIVRLKLINEIGNGKDWFLNDTEEKNFIRSLPKEIINNSPLIFYVFGYHFYLKAKADNFTHPDFSAKASNYLRKAGTFADAEQLLSEVNLNIARDHYNPTLQRGPS